MQNFYYCRKFALRLALSLSLGASFISAPLAAHSDNAPDNARNDNAPAVVGEIAGVNAANEQSENRIARATSNALLPFLAAGELSMFAEGRTGRKEAVRGAGALVTTFVATEALKRLFHEKRPRTEKRDSFPSGHAALSFAMAATLDAYKPHYKDLGYGMASAISYSRVELGEHHWHDVMAGAALGYFIGERFSRKRYERDRPLLAVGMSW